MAEVKKGEGAATERKTAKGSLKNSKIRRIQIRLGGRHIAVWKQKAEPVFLNVNGAPESIPRNGFRQPM